MSKVTYPRGCPKCGKKIKNRGKFSRHKKHCGTSEHLVQCPHCPKKYSRKDYLKKQVRKFHSEAAKRKAEESAQLLRLELLHSKKVPKLDSDESQKGGAVSTRSMKQDLEKADLNPVKDEPRTVKRKLEDDVDMSDLKDNRLDDFLVETGNRLELEKKPLFKATLEFLPYKRQGLKGAVKKEQLSVTFNQLRSPTEAESLEEGMPEALFTAIRGSILQQKLDETNTKVHLTITSKEHGNGTVQSGYLSHFKYGIPINEFVKRGDYVHQMF